MEHWTFIEQTTTAKYKLSPLFKVICWLASWNISSLFKFQIVGGKRWDLGMLSIMGFHKRHDINKKIVLKKQEKHTSEVTFVTSEWADYLVSTTKFKTSLYMKFVWWTLDQSSWSSLIETKHYLKLVGCPKSFEASEMYEVAIIRRMGGIVIATGEVARLTSRRLRGHIHHLTQHFERYFQLICLIQAHLWLP